MKPSAQNIYKTTSDSHSKIYKLLAELRTEIDNCANNADYVELCDYVYAINESHKLAEDIKATLYNFRDMLNKKICDLWLIEALQGKVGRSIKTEHVTATPDIGHSVNLPNPKNDPANYKQFMDYLGIDISKWGEKENEKGEKYLNEVLKPHWPGIVKLVEDIQASGEPVPSCLDVTQIPVYKVTLRKKKHILE